MADHFDASLAGFADWLPYAGRHKSPGTITQYVTAARRLAAWGRAQGRQGFAELTKADLRAFLSSLPGRGGRPASASSKATIWWAIRSLYAYLAEEEGVPDIAKAITGQLAHCRAGGNSGHLIGTELERHVSCPPSGRSRCGLVSELQRVQLAVFTAPHHHERGDEAQHLEVRLQLRGGPGLAAVGGQVGHGLGVLDHPAPDRLSRVAHDALTG
jgi:hypothetical protein